MVDNQVGLHDLLEQKYIWSQFKLQLKKKIQGFTVFICRAAQFGQHFVIIYKYVTLGHKGQF